jgi:LysM repeat protein
MLKEKYQDLITFGSSLPLKNMEVTEDAGKLKIKGSTEYQMQKDLFWDKVKTYANWNQEVGADISVEKIDIFGVYTAKSGDTLSKLAKEHFGDAKRYMDIFNANKDILTNPDLIKVGQRLKLPNK